MTQIDLYTVNSRVGLSEDSEDLWSLRNYFQVFAVGYKYHPAYKVYKRTRGRSGWDGKIHLIDAQGQFASGMLGDVAKWMVSHGLPIDLVDHRNLDLSKFGDVTLALRDYQQEAFNSSLTNTLLGTWWPRGIERIGTGGGKTELAVALCQAIQTPTQFIVNTQELFQQTQERFEGYGVECGRLGMGDFDINPDGVTVATIQSIMTALRLGVSHKTTVKGEEAMHSPSQEQVEKSDKVKHWLMDTKMVFFDEAHRAAGKGSSGNDLIKLGEMLPNADFRYGLTATPFMKDDYSNCLLKGLTGDELCDVASSYLISQGYLTVPEYWAFKMPHPDKCPQKWPATYDIGIVFNKKRNHLITKLAAKLPKPMLVVSTRTAHGEELEALFTKAGLNFRFLHGGTDKKTRLRELRNLKNGKLDIIIATTIFDEGVDIPDLRAIILAGGGKSAIKLLQRIGRTLRVAEGKERAIIVDFEDSMSKILYRHSKERQLTLKNEGIEIVYKDIKEVT